MQTPDEQASATQASDFTQTWRYKIGLGLIIIGHVGILLGVLGGFIGFGAATIGALVVGGEIVALASIVFLGKDGFIAIKKTRSLPPPRPPTPPRSARPATTSASPCCLSTW